MYRPSMDWEYIQIHKKTLKERQTLMCSGKLCTVVRKNSIR